jgi:hypothetical protein
MVFATVCNILGADKGLGGRVISTADCLHILVTMKGILCSVHSLAADHIHSYVIYYLYNLYVRE